MEIQIKYKLSREDYQKLFQYFGAGSKSVHQVNYFFDGSNNELSNKNVFFRIRQIGNTYKASLKECFTAHVERDGSITRYSKEIDLPAEDAERVIKTPSELLKLDGEIFKYIFDTFKISNVKYLGHFKNHRFECKWNDNIILLDHTEYPFGEAYECEISNIKVGIDISEDLQEAFEKLCKEMDIKCRYSRASKWENLIKGKVQ